jgi:hypothetical protein
MKKSFVFAAVVALGVSLGASRAAAQGPQGAGASGGSSSSKSDNSQKKSRSLNPIKWIKKDSKADRAEVSAERDKKLGAKLHLQGLLPDGVELKDACVNFRELGQCVAALHASQNTGIRFDCLKWDLTGIQTSADMSACKGPESDKRMSLAKAIELNKPDADGKAEAKNAEKQAQADLKDAGS